MTTLRLGISPCPNDVYIFSGLLLGAVTAEGLAFETVFEDVETLNGRARRGEMDVVKISYANYLHCADRYDLLECGGALGRGVGPLLLANGRDAFDPARETLVPGAFTTANFLLDFYLGPSIRKRFVPFDALYEALRRAPGSQGVVIHEKRFTYARDGLTCLADLGTHWEEKTGFGIPLGTIAVRREGGLQAAIEDVLRRSLRWADENGDRAFALCRRYAQDMDPAVVQAHIDLYVNDFSRDLGDEGRAAVAYFLEQQRRLVG